MKTQRRRFLSGMGATLALPLFRNQAFGQEMGRGASNAIFFWTPNGFNMSTFFPRSRFNGSAFGRLDASSFADRPLDTSSSDAVNGVPRRLFRHPEWGMGPLSGYADKVSVLRGMMNSRRGFVNIRSEAGGDHGLNTACRLTAAGIDGTSAGYALGRSVDYAIAERVNPVVNGGRDPLVLHVGRNSDPSNGNGTSFISYRAAGDPNPGINNPWVAFRDLLNLEPGSPAETYLTRRRRRVADLVKAELRELSGSLPAQGADRRLLTEWLGIIESTEDDLGNMGMTGLQCTAQSRDQLIPTARAQAFENSNNSALGRYESAGEIGDLMCRIIALSLVCGRTHVATLQWSEGAGGPAFGALNMGDGASGTWHGGERHHELSHRNGSDGGQPGMLTDVERNMSWIDQWYGQRFAALLGYLDGFGILDDTVAVWLPEFGDGRQHHFIEVPAVIAGSAGGYLRTGYHVDCSADGQWDRRLDPETNGFRIVAADNPANVYNLDTGWIPGCTSHNKLLTTIHNAVLPRNSNGQPEGALNRFPERDTSDEHNTVEEGELDAIVV